MFTICLDHHLRSTEPLEVVTCTCPERKVKMVSKGVTDLKKKKKPCEVHTMQIRTYEKYEY